MVLSSLASRNLAARSVAEAVARAHLAREPGSPAAAGFLAGGADFDEQTQRGAGSPVGCADSRQAPPTDHANGGSGSRLHPVASATNAVRSLFGEAVAMFSPSSSAQRPEKEGGDEGGLVGLLGGPVLLGLGLRLRTFGEESARGYGRQSR